MDFNGYLLVDKPVGISSFGVVARVRKSLSNLAGKKVKVGHTGTLDPFASGLMIIVVGKYCQRAAEFSKQDKTYNAVIKLGYKSSTGDPEGELTEVSKIQPALDDVQKSLKKFTGKIQQTPPIFSAIKINGQRAYKLARQGKDIEMPKRLVDIKNISLINYDYPELIIVCEVSSGTYIRSLAEDIGQELKTGAYLTKLRRTAVGKWNIDQACSLDNDFSARLQLF